MQKTLFKVDLAPFPLVRCFRPRSFLATMHRLRRIVLEDCFHRKPSRLLGFGLDGQRALATTHRGQATEQRLSAIESLNREHASHVQDPEIETRIAQYELAFEMQTSIPNLMDTSDETEVDQRPQAFGDARRDTRRLERRVRSNSYVAS